MISLDNLKTTINAIKCLLSDYPKKKDIPTKLPNPSSLTFTGVATGSYDGSEARTVEIPQGNVQPDWNQNNESAADHVKNRPFYTGDRVQTVLVEESTISFNKLSEGFYAAEFPSTFEATVGETYTVYWDGTAYECICANFESASYLGNPFIIDAGADTGEPFAIALYSASMKEIYTTDSSAAHTISISGFAEEVVKIDAKYLPFPFKPDEKSYLMFSSPNSFTLETATHTNTWNGTLEYFASDETWTIWDGASALPAAANGGEYVLYLRGTGNTVISGGSEWSLSGSNIACIGNIENLLDYATVELGEHPTMANDCYNGMFSFCVSLTQAPELPATTLVDGCYANMFNYCTGLTQAPELHSTTLARSCYNSMFYHCTSLAQAPALPATTLADSCYTLMFAGCTSLTHLPALPANTLTEYCYQSMFVDCSSLKLSANKTGEYIQEYRIPSSGDGVTSANALGGMFGSTGGTFTGDPQINTTYYLSSDNMIVRGNDLANLNGYVKTIIDASAVNKATLEADVSAAGFTKNTGTYSKPAGGIPKTDLASAVQSSLDKADRVDTLVPDSATAQNQLADKLFVYAQTGQVTPLFANSTADCTDTTKVYVLPDGYIYGYVNSTWTNTGHQFTSLDTLEKVIDATCDIETVSGGNYNLLKVSEVSFSSRLQDNTAGIVASTATNIVTGWIPVRQGKYYAVSALVDGIKDAAAGDGRIFVQRINAKKADGTILVYNRYPTELLTELSRGKAYSVPADATHMMFHIQIQDRTPQSLDISTSAKLKAFEPMIVEGDTAVLAVSNSIDFAYVDGDEEIPSEVAYTLKHDPTKQDKVSVSPYYRNVDYHMIPTAYYKGVGTNYTTAFDADTQYASFISAWDALISDHSGYVTKTDLGLCSDETQSLYLYDFKPVRAKEQLTPIPKVIITAGQHGNEKANVFGLYYFIDNLLNNWFKHPALEYLRTNVELLIVPVVNPSGFNNKTYKNSNGVNINRNYDAGWVLVDDPTSDQYGGAEPFDQPESRIIRDLILDNLDASLVIDYHVCSSAAAASLDVMTYYGVCPTNDKYYKRMIDVAAHQLTAISTNFNHDYSLGAPDTLSGYIVIYSGAGILRQWVTDQNVIGVLVEGLTGLPNQTVYAANAFKANEELLVNYILTALNYLKG